jgi:hypothetical protein
MPMQTRRKAPTSATTRYQHIVLAIFEEEPEPAQAGYMYTTGMPAGKPTLFVDSVPRALVPAVTATINYLVSQRTYRAGQTAGGHGVIYRLIAVEGDRRASLLESQLCRADPGATVLEMTPIGPMPEDAVEKPTEQSGLTCRERGAAL